MTKLEAVRELREYDHCFLSPEGVRELGDPFGVYRIIVARDNRSEFKGLTLNRAKEGDTADGLPAHTLAISICEKLGIEYPKFYGIGSQLRGCCEAIEAHLLKNL